MAQQPQPQPGALDRPMTPSHSPGWSLIDVSVGLSLMGLLLAGGLHIVAGLRQAGELSQAWQAWWLNDSLARAHVGQRWARAGVVKWVRLSAGRWQAQAVPTEASTDDPRLGPWRIHHWAANTPTHCQFGLAQEDTVHDSYSLTAPHLYCQNAGHAGNVRQSLWSGIRGWQLQLAVASTGTTPTWQWQTPAAGPWPPAVRAARWCWRTQPDGPGPSPLVARTPWPTGVACSLPVPRTAHRDAWQLVGLWHQPRPGAQP